MEVHGDRSHDMLAILSTKPGGDGWKEGREAAKQICYGAFENALSRLRLCKVDEVLSGLLGTLDQSRAGGRTS